MFDYPFRLCYNKTIPIKNALIENEAITCLGAVFYRGIYQKYSDFLILIENGVKKKKGECVKWLK